MEEKAIMKENIVGVDMGGTKIVLGLVCDGKVIRKFSIETPAYEEKEKIVNTIIEAIERLTENVEFRGIGMGVPGLLDEERGIVYEVTNIPSWDKVYLKKSLSDHFRKDTFLTNDANCFVLGERLYGNGQRFKNMVGITLGTGLGAGIILNEQLYSGLFASAGELGSIPYKEHNFEYYCSGKFFEAEHNLAGNEVFLRAERGDQVAKSIYQDFGKHLGNLVRIILHFAAPDAIFIGGSISRAKSYFNDDLLKSVQTFPHKMVVDNLQIKYSEIPDISILGAAALFQFRISDKTAPSTKSVLTY